MASAPPAMIDPSHIQFAMPFAPPPPPPITITMPKNSRLLDIVKIILGFLIILVLAGILAALLFVSRSSDKIDLRESNENIARLQRESNEKIAQLQYEQMLFLEKLRLKHQENLTAKYRSEDRLNAQQQRQEDYEFTIYQTNQRLQMEEKYLQMFLEGQKIRKEDLGEQNANLLSDFIEDVFSNKLQPNTPYFDFKIQILLHQFDSFHKSLLIKFLYKLKLINSEQSNASIVNLEGANLQNLVLNNMNHNSEQMSAWLNFNGLSLPATNLINSSFEQIYLNEANFSMCNLHNASFRWSEIIRADFHHAQLILSDFRYATVSESKFTFANMQRTSFGYANLTRTFMDNANLRSSNFQDVIAIKTKFSYSDLSDVNFQDSNLFRAQMDFATVRQSNFYKAQASQANFSNSAMGTCTFLWANLSNASFRSTFLAGSTFINANVENADFTDAFLAGSDITPGQLNVALSIARATLPDGSRGKNKNLVRNGDAQCTGVNSTIVDWINSGDVSTIAVPSSKECVFQARVINATLKQNIDLHRYKHLIQHQQINISIEMQLRTRGSFNLSVPLVYVNVNFIDSTNNEIFGKTLYADGNMLTLPTNYTDSVRCPSDAVGLQLTIVFAQINVNVDNIYLTIE